MHLEPENITTYRTGCGTTFSSLVDTLFRLRLASVASASPGGFRYVTQLVHCAEFMENVPLRSCCVVGLTSLV